jgi:hypothetical protein
VLLFVVPQLGSWEDGSGTFADVLNERIVKPLSPGESICQCKHAKLQVNTRRLVLEAEDLQQDDFAVLMSGPMESSAEHHSATNVAGSEK